MDKAQCIIEILNNKRDGTVHGAFMGEVADELAALRAENERLRGKLGGVASYVCRNSEWIGYLAKEALK